VSTAQVPGSDVRPISASLVRSLRHSVLRPFEPPEKIVYFGDEAPDTLHAGAFVGGSLVGIASVCREPMPGSQNGAEWRLRGMATVPALRGQGLGRALLEACFAHIREHGGQLLWCNARVAAMGFYDRMGFVAQGQEFEIVPIGPHYVMTRRL
jgi:GNAT superfamily N-acetyltransferase